MWYKRLDKWKNNDWIPQQHNAPAHTSLVVGQFLASKKSTVIPHPLYSPNLLLSPVPQNEIPAERASF